MSGMGPKRDDQYKVPEITADSHEPTGWVKPDPKEPLKFHAEGQSQSFPLVPLNSIFHERYAVYWKVKPTAAKG